MPIHVAFWKQLSDMVAQKRIIIIDKVRDECKSDPLKTWVGQRKITKMSPEMTKAAMDINNKYKLITPKNQISKSEADPYIIAYAREVKGIVFSYERKSKQGISPSGYNKVPDVCEALNIDWVSKPSEAFEKMNFPTIP